jgi:site-specific DNA-methyltransferase (adenine-specific)
MEDAGFNLKDMLAWMREKAPFKAQRLSLVYDRRGDEANVQEWDGWRIGNLRPTFEPVLWFTKPYRIGGTLADNVLEHGVGAFNEKAFLKYQHTPDNILNTGFTSGETGHHPSQKPLALMQCLIELTTQEGQLVLDPFCGSGSTLVAAKRCNRKYLGFEANQEYATIAEERLALEEKQMVLPLAW